MVDKKRLRIAAFGFRSVPMREGCAGADKFAMELLPRLVASGHKVTGYNRLYPGQKKLTDCYEGVRIKNFRTVHWKGFDTLLHSFLCTCHIIFTNDAKIVHIQNGGNSIFAPMLRLARKKVFISQDGIDWKRDKWPWYGKIFLKYITFFTAYLPNRVIFDNIFVKELFEKHYTKKNKYSHIPFGSEVPEIPEDDQIFEKLGIEKSEYFLFVGRFIPDKGVHYLISAFEKLTTTKKLVLVGGSPNPSDYSEKLLLTEDNRIVFAGYVYGDDVSRLMKYAYAYVQPSDVEGLSPVVLNVMGLGTPIICSDIRENMYIVENDAFTFEKGNVDSLQQALEGSLNSYDKLLEKAERGKLRILTVFSWDIVTQEHETIFYRYGHGRFTPYLSRLFKTKPSSKDSKS